MIWYLYKRLTFEQLQFELHRSPYTYMGVFFPPTNTEQMGGGQAKMLEW